MKVKAGLRVDGVDELLIPPSTAPLLVEVTKLGPATITDDFSLTYDEGRFETTINFGEDESPQVQVDVVFGFDETINVTPVAEPTSIVAPSGEVFTLEAMNDSFNQADEPGMYEVQQGGNQYVWAVNLSAEESRTKPLLPDRLEQLGLQLGKQKSVELLQTEQRQMRSKELEGKQKLWRWGILAALVAVAMETWIGGRSAKPIVTIS